MAFAGLRADGAERGVRQRGRAAAEPCARAIGDGGGGLRQWFNTAAYSAPANTPGYCNYFGNAPRNSIEGPGTVSNNMALSRTAQFGSTRSLEIRATINNVFNTVQYSGVDTTFGDPKFGEITSVAGMRSFQFSARFRY